MLSPLDISTKYYFWKPYVAFFNAFELKAYRDFVRFPDGLTLDLGCGDGTFAQMLKELLGFQTPLIGADRDGDKVLKAARQSSIYSQVINLDASYLPFRDASFDMVFVNLALYYVRPDPGHAIREIRRILKKRGTFICTVPTHIADKHYFIAELLERIGLVRLANLYRQRLSTRMGFWESSFHPDRWCMMIEESGLNIQKVIPFISAAVHRWWSILATAPFRVMGATRVIPFKKVHRLAASLQKYLMIRSYNNLSIFPLHDGGDYILIISRKSDDETK
jgi:ubiquinone/menaquinone biosynthesis C-methylase UbiE